jgi:hypothetical protein
VSVWLGQGHNDSRTLPLFPVTRDARRHSWHLADADPAMFDVRPKFCFDGGKATRKERGDEAERVYKDAISLLRSMTLQRTGRHKCAVIARVMHALSKVAEAQGSEALGAEDLMPLLAWCLARSRQPALLAQLGFILIALPERLLNEADGYTVASLTSAVYALQQVAKDAQAE